jgi:hypothetical protein
MWWLLTAQGQHRRHMTSPIDSSTLATPGFLLNVLTLWVPWPVAVGLTPSPGATAHASDKTFLESKTSHVIMSFCAAHGSVIFCKRPMGLTFQSTSTDVGETHESDIFRCRPMDPTFFAKSPWVLHFIKSELTFVRPMGLTFFHWRPLGLTFNS